MTQNLPRSRKRIFNLAKDIERRRSLRRAATPQEIILWSRLRAGRFFGMRFRRQHGIGSYVVDFYCPEQHLVIEIDGAQHLNADAMEYDMRRTAFLKQMGCVVVRFLDADINTNIEGVLENIAHMVRKL